MSGERGQAGVEFVALVLLACLALGALAAGVGRAFDGRAYGGFLARHFICAAAGACVRDERALVAAYGARDAARVRALAPGLVFEGGERQLPVDWRECRRVECASAPDDRALDTHLTAAGLRATAFTRLVRRGGRLYVEYWLYYPDSNSTLGASDRLWRLLTPWTYPGFHRDDWEGAVVRLDRGGAIWVRASSHGGFQGCKWRECDGRWVRSTGWVRVSRGSHSGHVPYRSEAVWDPPPPPLSPRSLARPRRRRIPLLPGRELEERTSSAEGLRLVPLETRARHGYVPLDPEVRPPWRKRAYRDPEADES
jgi:hypothetical protein